jgi:hypothetical protein
MTRLCPPAAATSLDMGHLRRRSRHRPFLCRWGGSNGALPPQMGHQCRQAFHRDYLQPFHQGSLGGIGGGDTGNIEALLPGQGHHGKDARCVPQAPIQGKLPQKDPARDIGLYLFRGQEDPQGHRQVVGGALLANVGRGQVDGNAPIGEDAARVPDSRPDPFPRFLDGGIRQAYDGEGGEAGGYVHLCLHQHALQAHHGTGENLGQHRAILAGQGQIAETETG